MVALEDSVGNFDTRAFVAAFEQAGGKWLPFPSDAYETYDGSHLTAAAAEIFSADLANRIRLELQDAVSP
jgi:hypothetical protein